MKTRTKGKEILKVALISVLSIGLFGAAFAGFNQLIFARATDGTIPLPPAGATTEIVAVAQNPGDFANQDELQPDAEAEVFVRPTLTVTESPDQHYFTIPASAMPMEDAAQSGARYIWDVFDTSIDGMYVRMFFSAHPSRINTWWVGNVYIENPDNPTQSFFVHPFTNEKIAQPVFMFVINGITGERIDITYMGIRESATSVVDSDIDARRVAREATRWAFVETGWFDMDIYEQVAFAGISDDVLETSMQAAIRVAKAQFNTSDVSDVRLASLGATGMTDGVVGISTLGFIALDNTGREAIIDIIFASGLAFRISTQHNDFMPGFVFHDDGSGIG
jgi:hypothetical protein